MSPSERKNTVIGLWRQWRQNMRDLSDGWFPYYDTNKQIHLFYEHLQVARPALLDMQKENPYLVIKAWVLGDMDL